MLKNLIYEDIIKTLIFTYTVVNTMEVIKKFFRTILFCIGPGVHSVIAGC